ncbi:MAG TPA: hypothetical protein VKN18_25130 [Blastocatellia bacterium]|nr:hypothetical protein [Blastocatellia bacterium]
MKAGLALILVVAAQTICIAGARAQATSAPNALGRWKVDVEFTDMSKHSLRFDVQDAGRGSFLLLDTRSSLIEPAQPTEAKWSQLVANQLDFSGAVEFKIGNVGREVGLLVFKGTFETDDKVSGKVDFFHFIQDSKDPEPKAARTGSFIATRVAGETSPKVQLLSPSFGKFKRGREVDVLWQADSRVPILAQQVFLSLDNGETFAPISNELDGAATEFAWIVPEELPTTKKARLKIIVLNGIGDLAEVISENTFKVR